MDRNPLGEFEMIMHRKQLNGEKAEVMIEGMLIMVLTMFLLIWILAVGFLYYQRYLMTVITNDAAAKIANTYCNPSSDIVMGYMEVESLSKRDLYRFKDTDLAKTNQSRAEMYVKKMMQQMNFTGVVQSCSVKLNLVSDSVLRKHVDLTTSCEFKTPFGYALKYMGMDDTVTYYASARADCTDIIEYITVNDAANYHFSELTNKSMVVKLINACMKLYNHTYAASEGKGTSNIPGSSGGGIR